MGAEARRRLESYGATSLPVAPVTARYVDTMAPAAPRHDPS